MSHNVLVSLLRLQSKDSSRLWLGRGIVVVAGTTACTIGLRATSTYDLVEYASRIGTAGMLLTTVAGLWFQKIGGPIAAFMSIVAGALAIPILELKG